MGLEPNAVNICIANFLLCSGVLRATRVHDKHVLPGLETYWNGETRREQLRLEDHSFENGRKWLAVVVRGVSRGELGDYYVVNVEVAFYE
jgi:hypothetical protein